MKKLTVSSLAEKTLMGACIGVTVGVCIEMFVSYLVGSSVTTTTAFSAHFARTQEADLVARVVYGLLGVVSILWSSFMYGSSTDSSREKPPLVSKTAIHIIGQAAFVLVAGLFLKWFDLSHLSSMGIVLAIFVAVYAIIWLGCRAKATHDIRVLNEQLKQRNESR